MKIEITTTEPFKPPKTPEEARKSKFTARARWLATIKVEGKEFPHNGVGEDEVAALTSLCSHLPVGKVIAFGEATQAEKAKGDKK